MERPQLQGTTGLDAVERCRECRGHVVQAGEEFVCTSCGVVARREPFPLEGRLTAPSQTASRKLGSFIGPKSDEGSAADFNGSSTVGYAKKVSDHMGEDQAAWHCASLIGRVAERLSLPAFAKENAVLLSERLLAEKRNATEKTHRATVPAISAYSLLSACRAGGVDHVSAQSIVRAFTEMGHRVTKSSLLRLGSETGVAIKPADPNTLLRTVVSRLESDEGVKEKLKDSGQDPGQYFRRLLEAAQEVVAQVHGLRGTNPRTEAAAAVYLASRKMGPKVLTQKQVAEALQVAEYTVREFTGWARQALPALNGEPA